MGPPSPNSPQGPSGSLQWPCFHTRTVQVPPSEILRSLGNKKDLFPRERLWHALLSDLKTSAWPSYPSPIELTYSWPSGLSPSATPSEKSLDHPT